jgi:predicted permease
MGSTINALATGLVPVLFMLLLGFIAAKRRVFDADQTTGIGTLVVEYTLPATLFISIIQTPRTVLTDDWKLLLVVTATFMGMFAVGYVVARKVFRRSPAEALIAGLLVGSPGVPFFGTTVLTPLFGAANSATIALTAIVISVLQVPAAAVLLERAATRAPTVVSAVGGGSTAHASPNHPSAGMVMLSALRKPVVIAPVSAIVIVLIGLPIPSLVDAMLTPLGHATSGVAVLAAGLTLGQQKLSFSWEVGWNVLGKMVVMPLVVLGAVLATGLTGVSAQEVVVSSGIMSTTIAVILAGHYKTYTQQASATMLLTAVTMFIILPLALVAVSIVPH